VDTQPLVFANRTQFWGLARGSVLRTEANSSLSGPACLAFLRIEPNLGGWCEAPIYGSKPIRSCEPACLVFANRIQFRGGAGLRSCGPKPNRTFRTGSLVSRHPVGSCNLSWHGLSGRSSSSWTASGRLVRLPEAEAGASERARAPVPQGCGQLHGRRSSGYPASGFCESNPILGSGARLRIRDRSQFEPFRTGLPGFFANRTQFGESGVGLRFALEKPVRLLAVASRRTTKNDRPSYGNMAVKLQIVKYLWLPRDDSRLLAGSFRGRA